MKTCLIVIVIFVFILIPELQAEKAFVVKKHVDGEWIDYLEKDENGNCYAFAEVYSKQTREYYTRVYKSIDVGNSWDMIYEHSYGFFGLDDSVYKISWCDVVDEQHMYMGYLPTESGASVMEYSEDGGKTFIRREFPTIPPRDGNGIIGMKMYNNKIGVICTLDEVIITKDNWKTYRVVKHEGDYDYIGYNMYFIDSSNVAIHKRNPINTEYVLLNIDNEVFLPYNAPDSTSSSKYPKTIDGVYLINDTLGFAIGGQEYGVGDCSSDIIWKTTDKGRHWEIVFENTVPSTFATTKILFENAAHGVALGGWGKIIETLDSGKTWHYLVGHKYMQNTITGEVEIIDGYIITTAGAAIMRYEDVTSSIEEAPEAFTVYPVPAHSGGALHIALGTSLSGTADISIYDLRGTRISTLFTGELSAQDITVSMPALPSGPYLIAITTPEGVYRRKVVLQ